MMISLSTSDWLDKFIKPGWVSGCCPGGLIRADPLARDESMKRRRDDTPRTVVVGPAGTPWAQVSPSRCVRP